MSNQEEVTTKGLKDGSKKLNSVERKLASELLEKLNINLIIPNNDLTGKRVRGFYLEEKKYEAESYIDVLRKILKIVYLKHPNERDKILSISGRKNKYFSLNPNNLRLPEQIRGTNIFFETNENAKSIGIQVRKNLKTVWYGLFVF